MLLLVVLSTISQVDSMPDNMCFVLATQTLPRVFISKTSNVETERKCKVMCGDNPECTAISYKDLKCTQLGAINNSMGCTGTQNTVQEKITTGCPVRENPISNFGNDPCVTSLNSTALSFNRNGICPRDSKNYVVRGIDEFGNRVTLDNDIMNMLTFDEDRNMWRFYIASADFTKWLVAVSCATAVSSCCAPVPLYNVEPAVTGQSPVKNNEKGICFYAGAKRFKFFGGKFKPDASPAVFSEAESATMTITCQAGIWLVTYLDNRNGWHIKNATCVP